METESMRRAGTLGISENDPTCSILAVRSLNEPFNVVAYNEFELIVEPLINEELDVMVVPGAYPFISKFIMNDLLTVSSVFTFVIPPLVFGSKEPSPQKAYRTLYNHPATNPLTSDVDVKWETHENVSSNSIACVKVLQDVNNCCAITNSECAHQYGLYVHKVLRASINMPFIMFTKTERMGD